MAPVEFGRLAIAGFSGVLHLLHQRVGPYERRSGNGNKAVWAWVHGFTGFQF